MSDQVLTTPPQAATCFTEHSVPLAMVEFRWPTGERVTLPYAHIERMNLVGDASSFTIAFYNQTVKVHGKRLEP
ncbi:MAG: hypothetical protein MJA83_00710, partial [Gammaproteobacteria bacterium]|nr:hypothetical protein [Gammaproteobacteria bacterium]